MPDDHATAAPDSAPTDPNARMGGFTRSRRDRMIAGVAGGVAERLDVDPLIVRGAFVILAVAGGSGILLYLLGWLLLPEEGEQISIAGQALGRNSTRSRNTVIALLVAVALFGLARPWHWSFGQPVVAVIVVVAIVALARHRTSTPAAAPSGFAYPGPGAGPAGAGGRLGSDPTLTDLWPSETEGHDQPGPDPTVAFDTGVYPLGAAGSRAAWWSPPAVPRQPSLVPPLLAGLAALIAVSAVIGATGWIPVPLPAVLTVALLMSLAGLVAGAQRRRFLGATLISLALAGMLFLSTAVPHPLAGGVGDRTWHPEAAQLQRSYRLGTGRATLDLSDIAVQPGTRPVRASVGAGDLTVIVANGASVHVRQRAAIGDTDVFGDRQGGVSVDRTSVNRAGSGAGTLDLDLQVGIGSIEVRRAAA